MKKPIVLIDMDDCIADFCRHPELKSIIVNDVNCAAMYEPGFFQSLKPVKGALRAVREIMRLGFEVQIATQPVAESAHSYSEKVKWLGLWFPELVSKMNMVQDKGLLKADYLVDDRADKWRDKFQANGGKFVLFRYFSPWADLPFGGSPEDANEREWRRIVEFFQNEKQKWEMANYGKT